MNNQNIIEAWEAFMSPTMRVPLKEAKGRIAANTIRQYPPGIPDIMPGMTYSSDILDSIDRAHATGIDIIGVDMAADQLVDVVIETSKKTTSFNVQTYDSREINEDMANEVADFFRVGFCAAPYFHFAFHESNPLESLPHTIDFEAYAVSIGLSDPVKRQTAQDTLREIAIHKAKEEISPNLESIHLPKGFHRWTDKNICRQQTKDRLSDPGYLTLVRRQDTSELVGLLHSRMGTVEHLFQTEEWSDPLLFSTYDDESLKDHPDVFFDKIKYHFHLNSVDPVMTISAQLIMPEVQGGDIFYDMMRSMAQAVRPEHASLPLLCEIPPFGTAHTLNTAFTDRLVFGVLKNNHPVVFSKYTSQALFPFIQGRAHWNHALRKAVHDKRHYRNNFFIPQATDNLNVHVKPNGKLGLAVFATANIPRGSRIAVFTGETYQSETALGVPEIMRDHVIQIAPTEFVFGYKGLAHCVCHSCNPNCGIRDLTEIYAVQDIAEGEQITWDYRCSENSNWVLNNCLCGSDRCTGFVSNYDSLPSHFKREYKAKDMVSKWILQSEK